MKHHTHRRTLSTLRQRGFIGAGIAMAFAAGLMAMYTAWGFTRTMEITGDNQRGLHARSQLDRLVQDIAGTSTAKIGGIIYPRPMALLRHGGAAPTTLLSGAGMGITVDKLTFGTLGDTGFLPSGFSPRKTMGDIRYIPFFYPQSTIANQPGYVNATNAVGLPAPNDVAFAVIGAGIDGVFDTTVGDARQGLARGDDMIAYATVGQVNGDNYRKLVENAGNIPDCGTTTDPQGQQVLTALRWNNTSMSWECRTTDIKSFATNDGVDSVKSCPAGNALGIRVVTAADGTQARKLECMPAVAPHGWSQFGSVMDAAGNLTPVTDGRLMYGFPGTCTSPSDTSLHITGASIVSQRQREHIGELSNTLLTAQFRCANGGITGTVQTRGLCPLGQIKAFDLSGQLKCVALDMPPSGGIESLPQNFSEEMRAAVEINTAFGYGSLFLNDRFMPVYANGRIFGNNPQSSFDLCAPGYRPGYVAGRGLGCYLLNNPQAAWGSYDDAGLNYADGTCPGGYKILRVIANNGFSNRVECVDMDEFISAAMPETACPADPDNRLNRGPGALTWDADAKRFQCSFVDRCQPMGSYMGLACPE